jgi:hypothetical protein
VCNPCPIGAAACVFRFCTHKLIIF